MTLLFQFLIAAACASISSAAITPASIKNDGLAIIAIAKAMPMLLTVPGDVNRKSCPIVRFQTA